MPKKKVIRDAHLNQEKKKMFMHIYEEYSDIFHLERELLTCTAVISHEIITRTNFAAENVQLYRLPDKYKPEVNKQIRKMLKHEIIQPSTNQSNALLFSNYKKSQRVRKTEIQNRN